jgi:uncharacterized protein YbjT (DUF2867 family)
MTGATGKAGGAAMHALLYRGAEVRVLTRDPGAADLPDDVEVVVGDLSDPGPAFDGVEAAFLLSSFADASTAKAAEHAGVRRVALLWAGYWGPVEEAFASSDVEWAALQPGSFLGNTLEWADGIRERGEVVEPFVDLAETMVHEADIGAVAAAVLLEDGHAGRTYELTGREPVSVRDRVDAIAAALRRPLHLTELSEADTRRRWLAEGYDAGLIDQLVDWYRRPVAEATRVSPDVERALGRLPLTFADWLPAHLDAFR